MHYGGKVTWRKVTRVCDCDTGTSPDPTLDLPVWNTSICKLLRIIKQEILSRGTMQHGLDH